MKNILARGGVEFVAVFLGIALSLWVDEYQKSKEARELNNQILKRLHDNLEADSTDAVWNYKAHLFSKRGSEKVMQWCDNGQKEQDSLDIFISSLAISTFFVNNVEEYNALKSSGRMELIKNEELVKKLHEYYTLVNFVKTIDERIADASYNRFIPFMMDYADFYGHKESRTVYDVYGVFELIGAPPISKLKMFASNKKSVSERSANRYLKLTKNVTEIRKMIRKELKN